MQRQSPYLILSLGVVAVSVAAVFIKLSSAPSLVIASYRMLLAFICLLPWAILRHRGELMGQLRKDLLLTMLSGIFLALHFASWISSFQYTSVASSTVLVSTQPIFAVVLSYLLFKERVTRRQLIGIMLAFAGSIIIGVADAAQSASSESMLGNGLALLGAVFAALYFLCGRSVRQRVTVIPYATVAYGISAVTLLLITKASAIPLYPYSWREFSLFAALAVVCTVIGHSSLNWSLEYLPAAAVGVAVLGEPIGASVWAVLLFNEIPSAGQLWGGALLLSGIILFMYSGKRKQQASAISEVH